MLNGERGAHLHYSVVDISVRSQPQVLHKGLTRHLCSKTRGPISSNASNVNARTSQHTCAQISPNVVYRGYYYISAISHRSVVRLIVIRKYKVLHRLCAQASKQARKQKNAPSTFAEISHVTHSICVPFLPSLWPQTLAQKIPLSDSMPFSQAKAPPVWYQKIRHS